MTGLDLESFLHLLRADVGAWTTLGLIGFLLAIMTWTSWGSRRALRKCLVLSIVAHAGVILYGSTHPFVLMALRSKDRADDDRERIRQIKVTPAAEREATAASRRSRRDGKAAQPWEVQPETLALAEARPERPRPELAARDIQPDQPPEMAAPEAVAPDIETSVPPAPEAAPSEPAEESVSLPDQAAPNDPGEIAAPIIAKPDTPEPSAAESSPIDHSRTRRRPAGAAKLANRQANLGRSTNHAPEPPPPTEAAVEPLAPIALSGPSNASGEASPPEESAPPVEAPKVAMEDPDSTGVSGRVVKREEAKEAPPDVLDTKVRRNTRPSRPKAGSSGSGLADQKAKALEGLALSRATPSGLSRLPDVQRSIGSRPLTEVPEVYRSRLDPNRSTVAQRAGASAASEQAVERALDWLARHQDADGRWDGGVARDADDQPIRKDDDYTVHCPPGDPCAGECLYWEADTALTGLALLAYLGSGYTHVDGKYTETVGKGLDFLRKIQTPDGDLRGQSRAVGMYCHAMASLALCEAYALTGDERLRGPVERAVGFLIRSRAADGQAWRYSPGARIGDTSILGWVVMVLKTAKVVGIPVSNGIQGGTLTWLNRVSSGPDRGLASYQPGEPPTPTMTAEAWVCRQFLGVGGPSLSSSEAAEELLANGPDRPGKESFNLYYWYYGTLAMYQYGGSAWSQWNAQVRDQLVRRQRLDGHRVGSWDPDDTLYGSRGGRIYSTALATLTLEVYYRFLRLYNDPDITPVAPGRPSRRLSTSPSPNRS
ncbi:hypothetical protein [Singulisphaera sp. PoT]|uniref:hypothetical protein n=1 Tax=Singulisphaera sp. PoT TaxID=3411797 RepID=UPI003BF4FD9C